MDNPAKPAVGWLEQIADLYLPLDEATKHIEGLWAPPTAIVGVH